MNYIILLFFLFLISVSAANPLPWPDSLLQADADAISDSISKESESDPVLIFAIGQKLFLLEQDRAAEKLFKISKKNHTTELQSHYYLGEIYLRRPKAKLIPFEQLKRLLKIDYFSKARDEFQTIIDLKTDSVWGYYLIARAYLFKAGDAALSDGLPFIDQAISIDHSFEDVLLLKAIYLHRMKQPSASLKLLVDYMGLKTDDRGRIYYYMALNYLLMNNITKCTQYYTDALEKIDDGPLLEEIIDYLWPLTLIPELDSLRDLSIEAKKNFIKNFWQKNDGDFRTLENERLFEHLKRSFYVRETYSTEHSPTRYDDRGRIYLLYGPPDRSYRSSIMNSDVLPNESWIYLIYKQEVVFDFVRTENIYLLVPSLKEALRRYNDNYSLLYELYRERSHLSYSYEKATNQLSSIMQSRSNNNLMFDVEQVDNQFQYDKTQTANAIQQDVSLMGSRDEIFSYHIKTYQYRGDSAKTSIQLHFGVPTEHLTIIPSDPYFGQIQINITVLLENKKDQTIQRIDRTQLFYFKNKRDVSYYSVFKLNIEVEPGNYELIVNLVDHHSGHRGVTRRPIHIDAFSQSPSLSDLMISIFPENDTSRIAENLSPYPFEVIKKSNQNYVLLEIGRLREINNYNTYLVSYKIISTKPRTNALKKLYNYLVSPLFGGKPGSIEVALEYQGKGSDNRELFQLDLKKIPSGECKLAVTVTDHLSEQTISKSLTFILID